MVLKYSLSESGGGPERLPAVKAPREDDPRVEHLSCVDNPRVNSRTTPRFRAPREDDPQVQSGTTPHF